LAKTKSTNRTPGDEQSAAYQAESAAIWEEAKRPYFDWSKVPTSTVSSTTNTVAWCRCYGHPDLKGSREPIVKSVLVELDQRLVSAGFTRDGKLLWRKGISGPNFGKQASPATKMAAKPAEQHNKSENGIFVGLKRFFKPAKAMIANLPTPAILTASSVFFEVQRDRAGACFYINAGIRPGGLHFAHSNKLAAEAVGSIYQGYYVFRPVHFTQDLPNTLKPDQFHYMRLKEDPRFMPFMLDLIESRMIACLSAWSDPTKIRPPMPSEMAKNSPLRM
jgi:hypothetical protein